MFNIIIIVSVVASTFLTGIFLDPFFPIIADSREAKSFICWIGALLIGAYGFKNFEIKNKNIWIIAFVFYTLATMGIHPHFRLRMFGEDLNGFWIDRTVIDMMIFFFMYLSVANASIKRPDASKPGTFIGELDLRLIFTAIFFCGFFSACYIFVQALNMDQLFVRLPYDVIKGSEHADLTSFIGQNTLAGAFIAMTIPFGFYLRRYLCMGIMIGALVVIMCKMAIISVAVGGIFYFAIRTKNPAFALSAVMGSILLALLLFFGIALHKIPIKDNGRIAHWKEVLADFNSPQVIDDIPKDASQQEKDFLQMSNAHTWQLTGIGPGAYSYIFVKKHQSPWLQIHNEYLEALYWGGIFGFLIACLIPLSLIFRGILGSHDLDKCVLVTSFLIICLNASTNFVWQVDPTRFLTVLIMGLLSL